MKRIMLVMGTRPEAIKLCPLVLELRAREDMEVQTVSTGQHREMLTDAMRAFAVEPDWKMDVLREGQSTSELVSSILQKTDALLYEQKPDMILVQGDTATAFAAGLAAFYRGIPLGHVEAGLRTYQARSPFPEEMHRRAVSLYADYHFAPTVTAKRNLSREGIPDSRIFITGNTVIDAMRITLSQAPENPIGIPRGCRLLLFTAHRRESIGEPLCAMLRALRRLVENHPDVYAVFPVHRNPAVREAAREILGDTQRIRMIDPPDVRTFHHLLSQAYLIMTDSGGIQEEAVALGIPTVVMRYSSERTEGMRSGVLKLAGSDEEGIVSLTSRLLQKNSDEYCAMRRPSPVYGDGNASRRIVDALQRIL